MKQIPLPIYRTVKPTGNTCHVTIPKKMQGERVVVAHEDDIKRWVDFYKKYAKCDGSANNELVVHEDMMDEIRDCVMSSIMLTGDLPSTALGSLAGFGEDDIARFLDYHKKYVEVK